MSLRRVSGPEDSFNTTAMVVDHCEVGLSTSEGSDRMAVLLMIHTADGPINLAFPSAETAVVAATAMVGLAAAASGVTHPAAWNNLLAKVTADAAWSLDDAMKAMNQ